MKSLFLLFFLMNLVFSQNIFYTDFKPNAGDALYADVSGVEIEMESFKVYLVSGKLYLFDTNFGKKNYVIFEGKGKFTLIPPTDIEKKQLKLFKKSETFESDYEGFVGIALNNPEKTLFKDIKFTNVVVSNMEPFEKRTLNYSRQYLYFDNKFISSYLNKVEESSYSFNFTSMTAGLIADDHHYQVTANEFEEVSFYENFRHLNDRNHNELINKFHKTSDYAIVDMPYDFVNDININHYNIEVNLDNNHNFSSKAEITFIPNKDLQWVNLSRYFNLFASKAYFKDKNEKISYYHAKENSDMWLNLNKKISAGEEQTIVVEYSGDLFERSGNYVYYRDISWYPDHGTHQVFSYELKYTLPEIYTVTSVGKLEKELTNSNETKTWTFKSQKEEKILAFNYGLYEKFESTKSGHKLTVYSRATKEDPSIKNVINTSIIPDFENGIRLYEELLDKALFDDLTITEVPFGHGISFPGYIYLSASTFYDQYSSSKGFDESFRAHELAHQWWFHGVEPQTYHDAWLSEGFSEFMGLWFMQLVLKDNEKYFKMLDRYFDDIADTRKSFIKDGNETAPIWMGSRANTTETAGDYSTIIYYKGAWVMHMIRIFCIGLNNFNEDLFKDILKDFYLSNKGKLVDTEAFRKICEKHIQMDMKWFFDQYVYNSYIPEYKFEWENDGQDANGKYLVKIDLQQLNVPKDFYAEIPIKIDFGNGKFYAMRVAIKGNKLIGNLPPMPLKPKDIEFNYLKGVFGEYDD